MSVTRRDRTSCTKPTGLSLTIGMSEHRMNFAFFSSLQLGLDVPALLNMMSLGEDSSVFEAFNMQLAMAGIPTESIDFFGSKAIPNKLFNFWINPSSASEKPVAHQTTASHPCIDAAMSCSEDRSHFTTVTLGS